MADRSKPRRQVGRGHLEDFISGIFEEDLHAKRVESLANGVDGVLHAATLGIRAIGQGLAEAQGLAPRHAIKQVDHLLSNPALSMESLFESWVPFVVGERTEIKAGAPHHTIQPQIGGVRDNTLDLRHTNARGGEATRRVRGYHTGRSRGWVP